MTDKEIGEMEEKYNYNVIAQKTVGAWQAKQDIYTLLREIDRLRRMKHVRI